MIRVCTTWNVSESGAVMEPCIIRGIILAAPLEITLQSYLTRILKSIPKLSEAQ
jgi:hypothetical protein